MFDETISFFFSLITVEPPSLPIGPFRLFLSLLFFKTFKVSDERGRAAASRVRQDLDIRLFEFLKC